uniref:Large ribosomal subunit protein bL32c n=1 Tax=Barleria mutabilis TaxID=2579193 RepID=A0A4P8NK09_9LAMI|nr:ribosomal protein L32 [Barleria mutabilis]
MAVPKKRTSASKKRIRKNFWKKGILGSVKSVFIRKISFHREFKKFLCDKQIKYVIKHKTLE